MIILLEKEIRKRTGILLSLMNPEEFVDKIKNPIFTIIGNNDELVS